MNIFNIRLCRDFSGGSGGGAGGIANDAILGPFGFLENSNDQTNQDNLNNSANAIKGIGNSVQNESAMSQQALQQWLNSYGTGTQLQNLYNSSLSGGNPEQNYQNQGPLAQSVYNQGLQQAQNPTAGWQSTLAPQLTQAQNQINEYYNTRGLDNSGIAIGSMGEAGVDLAIQNAQNEMAYQQQSLQNAGTLSSNISTNNNANISGLQSLYGTQQSAGQAGQNSAQQGFQTGAGYQVYPQQAALGSSYGQIAASQQLPSQLISAGGQLGAAFIGGV